MIATDVRTGRARRLSAGDAAAAVLASASIPGVYPVVRFDGVDLVDGGVASNTPISDAAELGATKIGTPRHLGVNWRGLRRLVLP